MDFGEEERALFAAASKQLQERAQPNTDIVAQAPPNTTAIARRLSIGGAIAGIAAAVTAQPAAASEVHVTPPDEPMRTLSAELLSAPATLVLPDYTSLLEPPKHAIEPRNPKPVSLPPAQLSAHEQTIDLDDTAEPASASMPLSSALAAEPKIVTVDTAHTPPAPLRFVARATAHIVGALGEAPVIGPTARSASEAINHVVEPLPDVPSTVLEQAPTIGRTMLTAPVIVTGAEAPLAFVTRGAQVLSPERKIADRHTVAKSTAEKQHKPRSRASIMKEMERNHYRNGNLPDYDEEKNKGILVTLSGPFKGHKLHKDVVPSLLQLNKAFKEKFGHNLKLNDSYRTYDDQVETKQNRGKWAAKPGTSKHGWGLAIDIDDIGDFGTEKYNFLREAGKKYGWDNPKGLRDGHGIDEYWHFEYYGANVAESEADTVVEEDPEFELPSQPTISDLLASAPVQTIAPIETGPLITPDATPESDAQSETTQSDTDAAGNQTSDAQTGQPEGQIDQSLIDSIASAPVQTITPDTGIDPSSGSNENGGDTNQEIQPNATDTTDNGNKTQPKESENKVAEKPKQQEHRADGSEYSKETLLKATDRLQQRGGEWINRAKSMRFFLKQDLKPIHAAGITGNFMIEGNDDDPDTDINPRAKQGGGGPGRGIAQWTKNERWQTHLRFCEKRKLDPWSMEAQLQFAWHEMEQGGMVSRMKGTTTIEDAVYRFERDFERAGKPAYKKRNKAAHKVHDALLEEARKIQNGQ